ASKTAFFLVFRSANSFPRRIRQTQLTRLHSPTVLEASETKHDGEKCGVCGRSRRSLPETIFQIHFQ
ncbi:MAG: hypothetical protein QXM52_06995, partial [Candidatus Bathyarchaeia archaeon]